MYKKWSTLLLFDNFSLGSSRDIWIGHHDEFNRNKDLNRAWYSASTGARIYFADWASGEPRNVGKEEHCAEFYGKSSFRWNDEPCDYRYFGYICEEHQKTIECRNEVGTKRKTANQENTKLSSNLVKTQTNVQNIIKKSRSDSDDLLQRWENSSDEILDNFIKSFNDIILKKPYLEAVVADIGPAVNELLLETKQEMASLTKQSRQPIGNIQLNSEISTNSEYMEYANKIESHKNDIDIVLTI